MHETLHWPRMQQEQPTSPTSKHTINTVEGKQRHYLLLLLLLSIRKNHSDLLVCIIKTQLTYLVLPPG